MLNRKPLAPNKQKLTRKSTDEILGAQQFGRVYKATERASIVAHDSPGKGQQGESVTGGTNKSKIIRKGTSRAT